MQWKIVFYVTINWSVYNTPTLFLCEIYWIAICIDRFIFFPQQNSYECHKCALKKKERGFKSQIKQTKGKRIQIMDFQKIILRATLKLIILKGTNTLYII